MLGFLFFEISTAISTRGFSKNCFSNLLAGIPKQDGLSKYLQ
jgi:hypothetical protein